MIEHCRVCNSRNLKLYFVDGYEGRLKYYRCAQCKLLNYDLDFGLDQSQYTAKFESANMPDCKTNRAGTQTYRFIQRNIRNKGRMMEIGCGNGRVLYLAKADGWYVEGMELSAEFAAAIRAEQGIEVHVADFLEYSVPEDQKFDLVVLRHVLEHLPHSIYAMRQIKALLNNGGYAVLEFPNIASVGYQIKRFMKKCGFRLKKFHPDWRPGHCNEFCRESFEYLLTKTGLELVQWETYSSKPATNAFYQLFPIGTKARALVRTGSAPPPH